MANPLPFAAADLIAELDRTTPAKCIQPGQTVEDAHRYAGKRELVESLLRRLRAAQAGQSDPSKPLIPKA